MGKTKEYLYDEHLTDWLETAECKMCGEPIELGGEFCSGTCHEAFMI